MKSIAQSLVVSIVPAILVVACGAKPSAAVSSLNNSFAKEDQSGETALTLSWVCQRSAANSDSGTELKIFTSAGKEEVEKVEIFSITDDGKVKRGTTTVCHTEYPAPEVTDGAIVATCNDTDWVSGHRVELSLGGFIPYYGTATVFAGAPGKMERIESLVCKKLQATR
jgi:hypothetical protein